MSRVMAGSLILSALLLYGGLWIPLRYVVETHLEVPPAPVKVMPLLSIAGT
ncbi:hypothetical protein [Marinobacter sp. X15-166B]|uniref:hypothetical protein n=1 Tax=Marinobacter sp. X15-166B TaxID=1897620 RepID=UPI0013011BE5|nr:hypothetical protein [Marinobacter sp. X15-166B]